MHNVILKTFANGRQTLLISERMIVPKGRKKDDVLKKYDQKMEVMKDLDLTEDEFNQVFPMGIKELHNPNDPEESARRSMNQTKQRIHDLVFSNEWDLFVTFTLDATRVDRYNYDEISEKLSKMVQNVKARKCPELEYIIVPELHKDGAFHFHGLFRNAGDLRLINSGKRDKTIHRRIIYNMPDFTLGYTNATKVTDPAHVCTYVTKYMTKELCSILGKNRKRFWASKNLDKTEVELLNLTQAEIKLLLDQTKKSTFQTRKVEVNQNNYTNTLTYIILQNGQAGISLDFFNSPEYLENCVG